MKTIIENELIDFAKNKAIKQFAIIQNSNGCYSISIKLTWKEGDWHLVASRGNIREWASLDRLVRHVRDKYKGIPSQIMFSFSIN